MAALTAPDRVACADALVKTRLKPLQYRLGLIDGFLAQTGLDLGAATEASNSEGLSGLTERVGGKNRAVTVLEMLVGATPETPLVPAGD
jgi:hypothetical protein